MNRSNPSGAIKAFFSSSPLRAASLIAGLVLLAVAQEASAYCELNTAPPNGYVPKDINMTVGRVVMDPNWPVSDKVPFKEATFPIYEQGKNNRPFLCFPTGTVKGEINHASVGAELGDSRIFQTNVQGIGIRLLRRGLAPNADTYYPHYLTGDFRTFSDKADFVVQLFKIAPVTGSGQLVNGIYTTYTGDRGGSAVTTRVIGDAITIVTPTCSVETGSTNISVQFGKVPQSNFKGKGTTTGDRDFKIKLKCTQGENALQYMIYLRMDATADPSNEQGVLKITEAGTSTATGVGIQVMDGNKKQPVKFGGDGMEVGPSKDGEYELPYTARYYQTADKVTPGRADGTATFTLVYK